MSSTQEKEREQPCFADVALNLPIETTFQYLIPDNIKDTLRNGSIVEVPFHRRRLKVCVVNLTSHQKHPRLRAIWSQLTPPYYIDEDLIELADWIAQYYLCGWGEALDCLSFIGFNQVEPKRERYVLLANAEQFKERSSLDSLTAKQKSVVAYFLEKDNAPQRPVELTGLLNVSGSTIKKIIDRGILKETYQEVERPDIYPPAKERTFALEPTAHQAQALERINHYLKNREHHTFLIHGITGSGKTEIYLQAIEQALKDGGQAIVLVPEISLTPQTVERFRARFGPSVGVYHSRLSLGEKYHLWQRIKQEEIKIVIGARSAVFSPFNNLRVIIIDEEHETTYKQEEAPRYHAREVAIFRGGQHNALVILGSATPSLESYYAATTGRYELITLPERIGRIPLPEIRLIDMGREIKEKGTSRLFSAPLEEAIEERLAKSEQSLLFLNRRGYFSFLRCHSCRQALRCQNCDVTMTYHRPENEMLCHYCNKSIPLPPTCPYCQSESISLIGMGTQRVEEEIRQMLPRATTLRVDMDTTASKFAFLEKWEQISRGSVDIILGTQMIAKGLHLKKLTLVGVVSADFALFLPDFRSAERVYSLLVQVAGRCGRTDKQGLVIIQTYMPYHYAIANAAEQDFPGFAERELRKRKVLRFPPHYHLLSVIFSWKDLAVTKELMTRFGNILRILYNRLGIEEVDILGPSPSPFSRLKGRYRWRLLLRSKSVEKMRRLLKAGLKEFEHVKGHSKVRITIDVDPLDLL